MIAADSWLALSPLRYMHKIKYCNAPNLHFLCFMQVKREAGDVSILVNNAGIVTGKKFMDAPDSLIEKTMEVNTMAHFWVCNTVALSPHHVNSNISFKTIWTFSERSCNFHIVFGRFGCYGNPQKQLLIPFNIYFDWQKTGFCGGFFPQVCKTTCV